VQRSAVDGVTFFSAPGPQRITGAPGRCLSTVVVQPELYGRRSAGRVVDALRAHVPAERRLPRPPAGRLPGAAVTAPVG
jgi:hypothetical protein